MACHFGRQRAPFAGILFRSAFSEIAVVSSISVMVPATTANIGPGFDCLGAALSLYNQFRFTLAPGEPGSLKITGSGLGQVSLGTDNLLYRAFKHLFDYLGKPCPAIALEVVVNVPLARGLGSSATAIVGGLVGANELAGQPLSQSEVMELAIALEGHPDNVVPALLGGCRLAASNHEGTWEICEIPWHGEIIPVVAIPDFELSTATARQVLPTHYSRADAIFNAAHLGLLLQALAAGNADWLRAALQDKIHQPYRKSLIQGYDAVEVAAIAAGAYGLVISGAGPTLLALSPTGQAAAVAGAMEQAWLALGVHPQVKVLALDTQGIRIGA